MKKYIKYIQLGFLDGLYYRTSSILTFLSSFLIDYVKIAIWYGAVVFAVRRTNYGLLNDTLTYMIMASAISALYRTEPNDTLSDAYINGQLIHRFVYPISIMISNYCEMIGKVLTRLLINVLPTLLILSWDYRPQWHIDFMKLPIIIINLIIGLYLNYIMFSFIDVLCFWLNDTRLLQRTRELLQKFFSGSLMPLWFFTETLSNISDYLPFEKQLYSPVSYLLGITIRSVYIRDLQILILYCFIFTIIVSLLWQKGVKRVESFGG